MPSLELTGSAFAVLDDVQVSAGQPEGARCFLLHAQCHSRQRLQQLELCRQERSNPNFQPQRATARALGSHSGPNVSDAWITESLCKVLPLLQPFCMTFLH